MRHILLVGALTSKPYAFTARAWELKSFDSLDFFDGLGSAVRYDVRGTDVMRILPVRRDQLNEEWISDKVRFMYDGLKRQRILKPYKRVWETSKDYLVPISWDRALREFSNRFSTSTAISGTVGGFTDLETQVSFKRFLSVLGNVNNLVDNCDSSDTYLFNGNLEGLERSDFILLVGNNLRFEAPLLNLRVRKAVLSNKSFVASIGNASLLTYDVHQFGNISSFFSFLEGRNSLSVLFSRALNPLILLGEGFASRADFGMSIFSKRFRDCVNILRFSLGNIGAQHVGISTISNLLRSKLNVLNSNWLYVLAQDELAFDKKELFSFSFFNYVVYQGHHGDRLAGLSDLIFPGVLPMEKSGTFMNCFGDIKTTSFIGFNLGDTRVDWKIFSALLSYLKKTVAFVSYKDLQSYLQVEYCIGVSERSTAFFGKLGLGEVSKVGNSAYSSGIENYYQADNITRSSLILALTVSRINKTVKIWK
jgi:NADH dehydrogenase/NADH:ubiquinone oxidoreductase subunit G